MIQAGVTPAIIVKAQVRFGLFVFVKCTWLDATSFAMGSTIKYFQRDNSDFLNIIHIIVDGTQFWAIIS